MKREIRTGPKRLRWTRRDWSGVGGFGQERRWDSSDGKFKREREARRAGLTGKLGKHRGQGPDPSHTQAPVARATGEREADFRSFANCKEEEREGDSRGEVTASRARPSVARVRVGPGPTGRPQRTRENERNVAQNMFRAIIRPRLGRRTRLSISSSGNVGVSRRIGRNSTAWASRRGVGIGGRLLRGLFGWIWRS